MRRPTVASAWICRVRKPDVHHFGYGPFGCWVLVGVVGTKAFDVVRLRPEARRSFINAPCGDAIGFASRILCRHLPRPLGGGPLLRMHRGDNKAHSLPRLYARRATAVANSAGR